MRNNASKPAIEATCRNTTVPDFVGSDKVFHKLVEALTALTGNRHSANTTHLRKQTRSLFVKIGQNHLAVFDQIPLVKRDDRRAAFADNKIGDLQILLFKRNRRIENDDNHFGKADSTQAIGDRKLFAFPEHAICGANQPCRKA